MNESRIKGTLITGVSGEGLMYDSNDRFTVHRHTHHGGDVLGQVLYRERETLRERERERERETERGEGEIKKGRGGDSEQG